MPDAEGQDERHVPLVLSDVTSCEQSFVAFDQSRY